MSLWTQGNSPLASLIQSSIEARSPQAMNELAIMRAMLGPSMYSNHQANAKQAMDVLVDVDEKVSAGKISAKRAKQYEELLLKPALASGANVQAFYGQAQP